MVTESEIEWKTSFKEIKRGSRGVQRNWRCERGGIWTDWLEVATKEIYTMQHLTTRWAPEQLWGQGPEEWKLAIERGTRRRRRANVRKYVQPADLRVGDEVYLWDAVRAQKKVDKMAPFWKGPYVLSERITRVNVDLSAESEPDGESRRELRRQCSNYIARRIQRLSSRLNTPEKGTSHHHVSVFSCLSSRTFQ